MWQANNGLIRGVENTGQASFTCVHASQYPHTSTTRTPGVHCSSSPVRTTGVHCSSLNQVSTILLLWEPPILQRNLTIFKKQSLKKLLKKFQTQISIMSIGYNQDDMKGGIMN